MVVEDSNQQSTIGTIASGYLKFEGYTGMFGSIVGFIFGILMIFVGIGLALFLNTSFLLVLSGIGLIIVLASYLGLRSSKHMREGEYYRIGKGWVKPK